MQQNGSLADGCPRRPLRFPGPLLGRGLAPPGLLELRGHLLHLLHADRDGARCSETAASETAASNAPQHCCSRDMWDRIVCRTCSSSRVLRSKRKCWGPRVTSRICSCDTRTWPTQPRGGQGHSVLRDRISPQSEVIRAVVLEDSPCCGGHRTWSWIARTCTQSEVVRVTSCPGFAFYHKSEVIRAILLEHSPCCGVPHSVLMVCSWCASAVPSSFPYCAQTMVMKTFSSTQFRRMLIT